MSNLAFKVGHDAEFFVSDATGKYIPAWMTGIGGTKQEPKVLEGSTVGTTYQEDGAVLELGMEPVSIHQFYDRAYRGLNEMRDFLQPKNLGLNRGSFGSFDPKDLMSNPEANVLGCNPDNNAWLRGQRRPVPQIEDMGNNRFAAGHLHFSFPETEVPKFAIVQLMDAFALNFWNKYELTSAGPRAQFYGMPGVYRDKPYGIEYRTPHNVWVGGSDYDEQFIFNCSRVVQAVCRRTSAQVREIYDSINWPAVENLLDLSQYPTHQHRARDVEYARLQEIANEFLPEEGTLE